LERAEATSGHSVAQTRRAMARDEVFIGATNFVLYLNRRNHAKSTTMRCGGAM
jgi:hypothetical protein